MTKIVGAVDVIAFHNALRTSFECPLETNQLKQHLQASDEQQLIRCLRGRMRIWHMFTFNIMLLYNKWIS